LDLSGCIRGTFAIVALVALVSSPVVAASRHATPAPRPSATAAVDHDGPFGIVIGEPIAELGATTKISPGQYRVVAPPRPNASLNYVTVYAFPEGGVCRIVATGAWAQFDTAGAKIRGIVDELASTLEQKYGAYTRKTDTCEGDNTVCTESWLGQLNNKRADYRYYWDLSKMARQDGVASVELDTIAADSITAAAIIYYDGKDDDACTAKIKAAQASSL
jgi:hypothetical protein